MLVFVVTRLNMVNSLWGYHKYTLAAVVDDKQETEVVLMVVKRTAEKVSTIEMVLLKIQ